MTISLIKFAAGSCESFKSNGVYSKSGCGLTQVPQNITPHATVIRLNNNSINTITQDAFTGLIQVMTLKLYDNNITHISPGSFRNLTKLKTLLLNNNNIARIQPNLFENLVALKELNLNNNYILNITSGAFKDLGSLKKLKLAFNKLTQVDFGMFEGLKSLQDLHLKNNKISHVATGAFAHMPLLHTLGLSDNELTTLELNAINPKHDGQLDTALELGINRNPLQCDSRLCWMKWGKEEGWITWLNLQEPNCTTYPHTDWDNITLSCPETGERTQHSNIF